MFWPTNANLITESSDLLLNWEHRFAHMKLPPGALLSGIGQLSMLTLEQGWPDPWRGVHLLRDLFFNHCVFSVVGLLGFFFCLGDVFVLFKLKQWDFLALLFTFRYGIVAFPAALNEWNKSVFRRAGSSEASTAGRYAGGSLCSSTVLSASAHQHI